MTNVKKKMNMVSTYNLLLSFYNFQKYRYSICTCLFKQYGRIGRILPCFTLFGIKFSSRVLVLELIFYVYLSCHGNDPSSEEKNLYIFDEFRLLSDYCLLNEIDYLIGLD